MCQSDRIVMCFSKLSSTIDSVPPSRRLRILEHSNEVTTRRVPPNRRLRIGLEVSNLYPLG